MASYFPQVVCLGEALIDRLGPLGEDPALVSPALLDDRFGGAPANVACGIARLGTKSAFVGRVGSDAIGDQLQQLFVEKGVDLSCLQRDLKAPTRIVLVRRDSHGDRSFQGFVGSPDNSFADQALATNDLLQSLPELFQRAQWLLVGTISLASETSSSALHHAVKLANECSVLLAIDVNWRSAFWNEGVGVDSGPSKEQCLLIRPLLEQAALVKLSAEEADYFFGSRNPMEISGALSNGPAVIVTNGANSISWSFGGQNGSLSAFDVDVVDSTGAGDAFLAGLIHCLCNDPSLLKSSSRSDISYPLIEVMKFSNACGALVCKGAGAIDPQPTSEEVFDFLGKF